MATKQMSQKGGATQKKGTADKSSSKASEKSQKMDRGSDSKSKSPGRH